jgi:hypothetical protein
MNMKTEEEKERKFVGDELKNIIAFDLLLCSMYSEVSTYDRVMCRFSRASNRAS